MKRVFVSQPMRGKTKEAIKREREAALLWLEKHYWDFEVLETYFSGFDGNRLQSLGKSISEGLALADIALFIGDWERYDGCRCEQFIAAQYGIPCLYYKNPDAEPTLMGALPLNPRVG